MQLILTYSSKDEGESASVRDSGTGTFFAGQSHGMWDGMDNALPHSYYWGERERAPPLELNMPCVCLYHKNVVILDPRRPPHYAQT